MTASLHRPADPPPVSGKSLASLHNRGTGRSTRLFLLLFLGTLVLTPLLILAGASQGYAEVLATIAALIALALVPWKPILGLYLVVISAVAIEQEPLPATPIGTDHLNIFFWPVKLQGLPERPIGFYILAILLILIVAHLLLRKRLLLGGRLFYPFIFFLACVAFGVLHGLATGGTFRIIVLEIRPFWYMFLTYILAFNIVTDIKHVRNIIWITVIGTAIKGVQGVFIVYEYLGGHIEGHNEIMAHEQSFFFVLVLLLLVMMLLHHFQRGLFIAILISLPCLLIALVANNRRADYVALLIGILVAWTLTILVKPMARRRLIPLLAICIVLGVGYVLAFQNKGGALGEPARAVISVFHPSAADARDAASNAYRVIENYDLKYTAAQSPLLGYGFGKPFLQPVVLPNVVDLDPYYLYIPHNNILWIWMRLGPLGFGALWYLIGAAIISGCLIARRVKDPQLQFFAIFAIAMLVMEVILAYSDYQFFFYRNMIFVGMVLGVLFKLPAIARAAGKPTAEDADDNDLTVNAEPIAPAPRPRMRISRQAALPAPAPAALHTASTSNARKWRGT
ncbi:MAG TPA: O-antigen ligase family protein [Ktedonobacterales bacterium]|nr:O-antigen ligase family protein [Ktedonobacterales bacterium]